MSYIIPKRYQLILLRPLTAHRVSAGLRAAHIKSEGAINVRLLTKNGLMRPEPRQIRRLQAPYNEDDEEDERMRSAIDKMFSERGHANEKAKLERKFISPRVVYPYPSFDHHRSHWAEFRRRLIYGDI